MHHTQSILHHYGDRDFSRSGRYFSTCIGFVACPPRYGIRQIQRLTKDRHNRLVFDLWKLRLPDSAFIGINKPEMKKANLLKGRDAKLPVYG